MLKNLSQETIYSATPVVGKSSEVVISASVKLITQSICILSEWMKKSNIDVERIVVVVGLLLLYFCVLGIIMYYCWCTTKDRNENNQEHERYAYNRIDETTCEMEMFEMPASKSAEESTCEAEKSERSASTSAGEPTPEVEISPM